MKQHSLWMKRFCGGISVILSFLIIGLLPDCIVAAGQIDTDFLEKPWPKESVRESEVHKYTVQWRQYLSHEEGLFVSIRFTAPTDRETTWKVATDDYGESGKLFPGVTEIIYLEKTPEREVIQLNAKILWKEVSLIFEIEREPPNVFRVRLRNKLLGEYRALFRLKEPTDDFHSSEPANTLVEMSTWLKPAGKVPLRTLASAERMMFLRAARDFLKKCDALYESSKVK